MMYDWNEIVRRSDAIAKKCDVSSHPQYAVRDRAHLIAMVRALSGEITRIVEEGVPVKTFYDPLSQADIVAWADREASDGA